MEFMRGGDDESLFAGILVFGTTLIPPVRSLLRLVHGQGLWRPFISLMLFLGMAVLTLVSTIPENPPCAQLYLLGGALILNIAGFLVDSSAVRRADIALLVVVSCVLSIDFSLRAVRADLHLQEPAARSVSQ